MNYEADDEISVLSEAMTSMLNSFDEVCPEFCSDGANSMALNFVVALALVCAASSISPGEVLLRIHNPSGFTSPCLLYTSDAADE